MNFICCCGRGFHRCGDYTHHQRYCILCSFGDSVQLVTMTMLLSPLTTDNSGLGVEVSAYERYCVCPLMATPVQLFVSAGQI